MEASSATDVKNTVSGVQPTDNAAGSGSNQDQSQSSAVDSAAASSDPFIAFLKKSLGKSGTQEVDEEALFSSAIAEQLNKENAEAGSYYEQQVADLSKSMLRPNGTVPMEDVAKAALKACVDAGKITMDKAEMINAAAFQGAQLDDNADALWDGMGDTKSVMSADEAMSKLKAFMDKVDSGEVKLEARSLDIPSNQGMVSGMDLMHGLGEVVAANGKQLAPVGSPDYEKQIRFTWKHESDVDGNLAILPPLRLTGNIDGISLYNSSGDLIEEGDYSKVTGNGREVYRFNEPGGEYGKDIDVVIKLKDGKEIVYHVDNGGERTYVPQDEFKTGFNPSGGSASSSLAGSSSSSGVNVASSSSSSSSSESSSSGSSSGSSGFGIINPAVS